MTSSSDLPPIRRVVTGHDENQHAVVLWDSTDLLTRRGPAGNSSTAIWCTDSAPTDNSIGRDIEDMGQRVLGTAPPPQGTRVTINDLPPGRISNMHRTETVDYAFVLFGEVVMELDDSSVTLKTGDCVVQRGTNHRWINKTTQPARIAFVLVDATPLGIGHAISGHSIAGH
jgi:quercetin dioxygenase-like cupin family protein